MFPNSEEGIANLATMAGEFASPEEIDDGRETAPSKRIIKEIPGYEDLKNPAGLVIAMEIGLEIIRKSCPHFNHWLSKLEKLSEKEK